jgi:hypothetical protein
LEQIIFKNILKPTVSLNGKNIYQHCKIEADDKYMTLNPGGSGG